MAGPTTEPTPETSGTSVQETAETSRATRAPAPLEERARANAEAAMPEARRELPLWTGNDLPEARGGPHATGSSTTATAPRHGS